VAAFWASRSGVRLGIVGIVVVRVGCFSLFWFVDIEKVDVENIALCLISFGGVMSV